MIKTSKGETFENAVILDMLDDSILVQLQDERRLSEIVPHFEGCESYEYYNSSGEVLTFAGYTRIQLAQQDKKRYVQFRIERE
jgi:hypothetical protein